MTSPLGLKARVGSLIRKVTLFLPTAREGNVFTGVCLSTISIMVTDLLLGLVTARSVRILLGCFLVVHGGLSNWKNQSIAFSVRKINV